MNKQELAASIMADSETKISKSDVNIMIDTVLEAITNGVNETGEVNLYGFGKFEKKLQKGRKGNVQVGPSKGKPFETADRYKVTFTASKIVKDLVNA